jgi:hypothetical protein
VPQEPAGVFDSLLPADFRATLVPGQVQHQIPWQAGQITQPGIRTAQVRDGPRFPGRGQEDRSGLPLTDGLREQLAQLPADGNTAWLPGFAGRLVLLQDDCISEYSAR